MFDKWLFEYLAHRGVSLKKLEAIEDLALKIKKELLEIIIIKR